MLQTTLNLLTMTMVFHKGHDGEHSFVLFLGTWIWIVVMNACSLEQNCTTAWDARDLSIMAGSAIGVWGGLCSTEDKKAIDQTSMVLYAVSVQQHLEGNTLPTSTYRFTGGVIRFRAQCILILCLECLNANARLWQVFPLGNVYQILQYMFEVLFKGTFCQSVYKTFNLLEYI